MEALAGIIRVTVMILFAIVDGTVGDYLGYPLALISDSLGSRKKEYGLKHPDLASVIVSGRMKKLGYRLCSIFVMMRHTLSYIPYFYFFTLARLRTTFPCLVVGVGHRIATTPHWHERP